MPKQHRRNFLRTLAVASVGAGMRPWVGAAQALAPLAQSPVDEISPQQFTVNILQTTDVHCQVHPHDELYRLPSGRIEFRKAGGYAHLATFFQQMRRQNPDTFIIDTGDMFQGSELSVRTTGYAMVEILNQMGYDLYLPGNWEVIYYKKTMQKLLGGLYAPKVCANMYHDAGEGKRGELIFPPYYIWHVRGVKIGFLGYTDHLVPIRQSPNYSRGIIYTVPEENLAHYVQVLREQEQCAMVLIIAHLGLSQQIHLANNPACEGVDYILGGDTHERVRVPVQCRYSKVVEPGAFGSFVGQLEATFTNGKLTAHQYRLVDVNPQQLPADPAVQEVITRNEAPFASSINKVVGYSTIPLYRYFVVENPIDTLILNALAWQLPHINIILSNGFRFCPPRTTPDSTGLIPITEGFIYDMLPVDSTVRTAQVTGRQLLQWLEKELNNVFAENASERFGGWVIKFHGMKMTFKAYAPQGQRVQSVQVAGKPLSPDATYTIAACERDGDPNDMLCRIKNVQNAANTPFTLHNVLRNYLAANSSVTPTPPKNAVVLDAPQDLLTQIHGVAYDFY